MAVASHLIVLKEYDMILILLCDGFEEIEALAPLDLMRRAELDVRTVGVNSKIVVGSHNIPVVCDLSPSEVPLDKVDAVILPGGMPGASNLDKSEFTDLVLDAVIKNGGKIGAICAAPFILGKRGLLKGRYATCYPGFEKHLEGANIKDSGVVTDGNITTAKGMGVALAFAKELVSLICGKSKADELSAAIMED